MFRQLTRNSAPEEPVLPEETGMRASLALTAKSECGATARAMPDCRHLLEEGLLHHVQTETQGRSGKRREVSLRATLLEETLADKGSSKPCSRQTVPDQDL